MTTLLALALMAQGASAGLTYTGEVAGRYWLSGSAHGAWEGRTGGPFSDSQTRMIVSKRAAVRANSALATPNDLWQLSQVLAATDAQLAELLLSKDSLLVRNAITEAFLRRRQSTVPALIKMVDAGKFGHGVISALAAVGGHDALHSLKGLLKKENTFVTACAAYGLAANGKKDGAQQLWYAVRHPLVKSPYEDRIIRGRAARALLRLDVVTTRKQLDEIFRMTKAEGRYLCPLLAKSKRATHLTKLRDLAVDQEAHHLVRKWATEALAEMRGRKA